MVLAQYYNFARLGHDGYRYVMETMKYNARTLAKEIEATGEFEIIGAEEDEQLPLVAFKLAGEHDYDEFDVAAQLAAERGWMVPAYTLPAQRRTREDHARARQGDARALADERLGEDIAQACTTLAAKGAPARARPQAREDEHRILSAEPASGGPLPRRSHVEDSLPYSRIPAMAPSGAFYRKGNKCEVWAARCSWGSCCWSAGVLNIVYGIAAVGDAKFWVDDTQFVFSSLHTWGWITIILGVIQLTGSACRCSAAACVRPRDRARGGEPSAPWARCWTWAARTRGGRWACSRSAWSASTASWFSASPRTFESRR